MVTKMVLKLFAFQHGVALFFLALLGCLLLHALRKPAVSSAPEPGWVKLFELAWPLVFLAVTLVGMGTYLAYPSFADHVESSVVVLGQRLLQGEPIYPLLFDHTLSGLLYSPLLFEINAAALALPLPPELSSKLPALLAYLGAIWACVRAWPDRRAWMYGLYVGTFSLVFMNSGQPFLLLFTALALLAMVRLQASAWRALLVGAMAGACMAIKLHGLLYVAAVYLVMVPRWWVNPLHVAAVVMGAGATFLLTFLPEAVDLRGFFNFIAMATQHGLSPRILVENLFFVAALWMPVVVLWWWQGQGRRWPVPMHSVALIVLLEVVVAVIGSKKGAGSWHLLPFVVTHGQIMAQLLPTIQARSVSALLPAFAAALCAMLVNTMVAAQGQWQTWHEPDVARAELLDLATQYPGLVIATGQERGYEHIYHRVYLERLGVRQIDYPGYVDLNSAGISDKPLAEALRDCTIPSLAVPRGEPAFSNGSNYTKALLFSDEVRQQFARHFTLDKSGVVFDVYVCVR